MGPAPRDPDDPDHWDEWYDEDGAEDRAGFGWPVRIAAVLAVAAIVLAYVLSL